MPRVGWLLAQTSTSDEGFSVPVLVVAAAVGVVWLAFTAVLAAVRRAPDVGAGPPTQELPAESPALAGLLCDDFEVAAEAVPATVLDLAARGVLELAEVQPGRTICRVRRTLDDADGGLTDYEQRVLSAIGAKAIDGVVPTEALTTGPEDRSLRWRRDFEKEVIAEAHEQGLTYDRWPAGIVGLVGAGALVLFGLVFLSGAVGGETSGDDAAPAIIAGGITGYRSWRCSRSRRAGSGRVPSSLRGRARWPPPAASASSATCTRTSSSTPHRRRRW